VPSPSIIPAKNSKTNSLGALKIILSIFSKYVFNFKAKFFE